VRPSKISATSNSANITHFSSALMCALALGGTTIPFLMRLWPAPLFIALVVTAIAARVMRNADAFR
jgi:hypothetical protein